MPFPRKFFPCLRIGSSPGTLPWPGSARSWASGRRTLAGMLTPPCLSSHVAFTAGRCPEQRGRKRRRQGWGGGGQGSGLQGVSLLVYTPGHLQMRQNYLLIPPPPLSAPGKTHLTFETERKHGKRDRHILFSGACRVENSRELTRSTSSCLCMEPGEAGGQASHRDPPLAPL